MLPLTGERTLPGIPHENYWFRRHEIAYHTALPLTRGARVLDAGCGEGYGTAMLAEDGAAVVGVDLDLPTVQHLHRSYPQVPAVLANLVALPFAEGTFDTVVTLQVVEHLWDQPGFVSECARVLRPYGLLVLSTPNRLTFSPGDSPGDSPDQVAGAPPTNPFHARELDPQELVELVAPHFDVVRVLGVRHGPRLRSWESERGSLTQQQLADPPDEWPKELHETVASVRADDFDVDDHAVEQSLDLLVVAERRP